MSILHFSSRHYHYYLDWKIKQNLCFPLLASGWLMFAASKYTLEMLKLFLQAQWLPGTNFWTAFRLPFMQFEVLYNIILYLIFIMSKLLNVICLLHWMQLNPLDNSFPIIRMEMWYMKLTQSHFTREKIKNSTARSIQNNWESKCIWSHIP